MTGAIRIELTDPDSPLLRGFSIAGGVVRDVPVSIHADANQKQALLKRNRL